METQRGRSAELDAIQTGTATLTLDNADGRFTPGRAYGKELFPSNIATAGSAVQSTAGFYAGPNTTVSLASSPTLWDSTSIGCAMTSAHTSGSLICYTDQVPVTPGVAYRSAVMARAASSVAVSAAIRYFDASGNPIGLGSDLDVAWRQYADVVAASAPAYYWRMDNAATGVFAPLTGGNSIVPNNTAWATAWSGGTRYCASFTGSSSSYATVYGLTGATTYQAFTIEFWFQTSTKAGTLPGGAYIDSSGKFNYQFLHNGSAPGPFVPVKTAQSVADGMWHHAAIVLDGYTGTLYIDGLAVGTDTPQSSSDQLYMPSLGKFGQNFNGPIGDFAVYGHPLSVQTINNHFRHGATTPVLLTTQSSPYPLPWRQVDAASTAPANAATGRLEITDNTGGVATTVYLDGFTFRSISPLYGRIRPRRRVRVISTTGQNLMPPGFNTYAISVPAPVDANEVGYWPIPSGGAIYNPPGTPIIRFAPSSNQATLAMSADLSPMTWLLLPGHSYTWTCQAMAVAVTAGQTLSASLNYNLWDQTNPGAITSSAGSSVTMSTSAWNPVTVSFTVPATMIAPVVKLNVAGSETGTGTHTWNLGTQYHQLIDTTNGQPVPAYTIGDGTLPVFSGFVDKWEDTHMSEDYAETVVTCSDAMRVLGETDVSLAAGRPEALNLDLAPLGVFNLAAPSINANVAANPLTGILQSGNSTVSYNGMSGVALVPGNTGIQISGLYNQLLAYPTGTCGYTVEFWVQADPTNVTGDRFIMGNASGGIGPIINHYYNGSSACQWSVGWKTRTFGTMTSGSDNFTLGNVVHLVLEVNQTISGSNKTIAMKLYVDGTLVVSSSETGAVSDVVNNPMISGPAAITDTGNSLTPYGGNVYGLAVYGKTGLGIQGFTTTDTLYYLRVATRAAQLPAPTIVGSNGVQLTNPDATGTALDVANNAAKQEGGYCILTRYGGWGYFDRYWRTNTMPVTKFSTADGTGPDSGHMFVSDIDRTWSVVDVVDGTGSPYGDAVINTPGGVLAYGFRRTDQTLSQNDLGLNGGSPFANIGADFLTRYLSPAARCDTVTFSAINQALASKLFTVDVGSRVVLSALPDNAPASDYYAWVEAVKVKATADGGTLVPTVELTLSPDFTHIDYI